uniref:Uncharacterized protein n=1 Tax=Knipowitschia caucasica TaxID=637954 RepID=A0AAV2LWX5_KNICA
MTTWFLWVWRVDQPRRLSGRSPGQKHFVFTHGLTAAMADGYMKQLWTDAHFLSSHQRMDSALLDKLVLQLNRTYPQVLSDKEAHQFRNIRVVTRLRLAELLRSLHCKGEDACHEFYRGIQIHAEDMYCRLPSRVRCREMEDPKGMNCKEVDCETNVLNNKGPIFFLSCFSLAACVAVLYYSGGGWQSEMPPKSHSTSPSLTLCRW